MGDTDAAAGSVYAATLEPVSWVRKLSLAVALPSHHLNDAQTGPDLAGHG